MHFLGRYFPGSRAFGAFAALLVVAWFVHVLLNIQYSSHRADAHTTVARALADSLWQQHRSLIEQALGTASQNANSALEPAALERAVAQLSRPFGDTEIRIYRPDGVLIFASDGLERGGNDSDRDGVVYAGRGEVYTVAGQGGVFGLADEGLAMANALTTFVPVFVDERSAPVAVFEVQVQLSAPTTSAAFGYVKFALLALLIGGLWLAYRAAPRGVPGAVRTADASDDEACYPVYLDSVTGLMNRTGFRSRMAEAFARARRNGRPLALMHLGLNRFKLVNDSLGHDAGDDVLKVVGARLLEALRETDLVFRVGGDEFALLLEDLERSEDVVLVADRIVTAMARPFVVSGREVYVTASVGMAIYPRDSGDTDTLISQAGAAMARAKKEGASGYRYYDDSMNIGAVQHLELETALQTALEREQFQLYYQIKVSAAHGAVVGIEALLRWRRPGFGVVSPVEFIPNLERSGLIIPVGRWAMAVAAAQVHRWMAMGMAPLRVSVNISAVQFHAPGFVESVREVLASTGLPPRYLELELTETVLVERTERAMQLMDELKACGVALSIDDFGVGYSSLNYLKRFPVDYLKVDRSFVLDLLENPKDAAITKAIASLARSLGIGLVAEGVENRAQAEWLIAQGYDELQGFLYSRPIPENDCARLIRAFDAARQNRVHSA